MRSTWGIGLIAAGLLLAACGSSKSSSTTWKDVRHVTVTDARPGLPPPGGLPHTTSFTTPSDLDRVTAALNAHHIHKLSSASANNGCAGGATIAITITRGSSAPVRLSGYTCANTTTGDIGGDLSGFLTAIGVSTSGSVVRSTGERRPLRPTAQAGEQRRVIFRHSVDRLAVPVHVADHRDGVAMCSRKLCSAEWHMASTEYSVGSGSCQPLPASRT